MQRGLRRDTTLVLVFETTVHNNSAISSTASNRPQLIMMKGQSAGFFLTSIAALEEAEFLCIVLLSQIPVQVRLFRLKSRYHEFFLGTWSPLDGLKNAH
jgi:hypothetical protein